MAAVSRDELLTAAAQAPRREGPDPLRAVARAGGACAATWRRVNAGRVERLAAQRPVVQRLAARGVAARRVAARRVAARGVVRGVAPQWVVVVALALAVVLGLAVYRLLASSPRAAAGPPVAAAHAAGSQADRLPRPDQARRASQAAAPAAPGPAAAPPARKARGVRVLDPVRAAAFGPGGGDNPQLAHLAIDGRRGTGWRTDWYTSPRFGNLYRGTGLLLAMRREVAVTRVQVSLGRAAGASFQLRIGPRPVFARLRPAAHAAGVHGTVRLRLPRAAHGRYILLWITRLPRSRTGTFQAGIYNVKLQGRG
jgi:hypothetical protein